MNKNKFSIKTRIIALILSIITIVSTLTVISTVNVSAQDKDDSSIVKSCATVGPLNNFAKNLISAANMKNPYLMAGSLITSCLSLYLDGEAKLEPSTQDIINRLDEISEQMTNYYNEEKCLLDKIDLKIDGKQFKDIMNDLLTYNEEAVITIKSQLDYHSEEIIETTEAISDLKATADEVNASDTTKLNSKTDQDRKCDIYKTIIEDTTGNKNYTHIANLISNAIIGSSVYEKAFNVYLEEMKKTYSNADKVSEKAQKFIYFCEDTYSLAYEMRLTGYTAEKNLYEILDNQAQLNKLLTVTDADWKRFQKTETEFENALEDAKTVKVCTVTTGDVSTPYHSISDAWYNATKSSGDITIKLEKNVNVNEGSDFISLLSQNQGNKEPFKNGSLLLNNKDINLTFDLNGHNLSRKSSNPTIYFENVAVTIKNGSLDSIEVLTTGKNKSHTLNLENISFSGSQGIAVYSEKTEINAKNCSFDGYNNSAVSIREANASFEKCKFTNNSTKSDGGAIYEKEKNITLKDCTFDNNNCTGKGGAIYITKGKLKDTGSTFTSNKSNDGGAIYTNYDIDIYNSTFKNNKSDNDGGAYKIDFCGGCSTNTAKVTECKFYNNEAKHNGGAIYADSMSYATLENVEIKNNTCGDNGGGMYCQKGKSSSCDPDLYGTITITDNHKTDGTNSNLFLGENSTSKCIVHCHNMSDSSKIGITSPTGDKKLDITGKENKDFSGVFSYDTGRYRIRGYKGFWGGRYVEIKKN